MSMQAMQTLYDLRENNQLCDAIIVLDDGTEIPIHRALLCACSSYFKHVAPPPKPPRTNPPDFRAAFTTLLHNKNETKVQIPGVSSEMMHILLNYAYLRKLDLNKNNVFDVLITADYLSMLGALEMCCKYLESILSPKNCIGILLFARNHFCTDLALICWRYIMKNFIQISQLSEEILMLSLKDFQEIINADNLNVKSEEIVWETILKWINHDPEQRKGHIVALMKCIRLGLLETQFFMEKVKDHPYVTSCEESRPMVIETLKFLYDLERIMHK